MGAADRAVGPLRSDGQRRAIRLSPQDETPPGPSLAPHRADSASWDARGGAGRWVPLSRWPSCSQAATGASQRLRSDSRSRCQHENPGDATFCIESGGRLALACSACGTELPAAARGTHERGRCPRRDRGGEHRTPGVVSPRARPGASGWSSRGTPWQGAEPEPGGKPEAEPVPLVQVAIRV